MMWPQPFSRILIWPAHNKPCRTQMCFFWTLRYYKCRDFSFLQLLYEWPDYGFVWPSTSTWNIRWFSSFKVKLWVNPNPTVLLFYRAAFLKIEITSYFPPKFSNPHEYCGVSLSYAQYKSKQVELPSTKATESEYTVSPSCLCGVVRVSGKTRQSSLSQNTDVNAVFSPKYLCSCGSREHGLIQEQVNLFFFLFFFK